MGEAFDVRRAIAAFPEMREEIAREVARAARLRNECGCTAGAAVALASLVAVLIEFHTHPVWMPSLPARLGLGLGVVFVSALIGKVGGIAIARLRVALLYRRLRKKYATREEYDVNMCQIGRQASHHLRCRKMK